jgi:hypothetical protein
MSLLLAMLDWGTAGAIAVVLSPIAAVPLTIVTFHLRALGEQHRARQEEIARRVEALESSVASLRQELSETQRDYTGKEEWLRESLSARRQIERLSEGLARMGAIPEPGPAGRGQL